ncbi:hypothetical protein EIP91_006393 [Steccherinum ochraceum]|uniref:Uncharacterized protein n=1 Tax=Steccherinum ochraceum TaxID=92696 RepID=A0A4R0R5P8_9APHY|nr:hypothetical protein EIP91_006393 [Steccherinum ochraceum]
MEPSHSVPNNLYASVRTVIPLQNSASVQSHLSAPGSQQRIRHPSHVPPVKKATLDDLADIEANFAQSPTSLPLVTSLFAWLPAELHALLRRLTLRRWLRWILGAYCLLSVVFLLSRTLHFRPSRYQFLWWSSAHPGIRTQSSSLLQTLSVAHVATKLTSLYPEPKALIPNVFKADTELDTVTACAWMSDTELETLPGWMSKWPGLVSLLVVTTAETDSPEFTKLYEKISGIRTHLSRVDWLSLHVLQVSPQTPNNPNAFLNLARVLSPTPRVVLFPGNLSVIPPKALYRSYFSDVSSSAKNTSHRPMIFTSRGQTTYPFAALAPVVLNRDDPLWCTERFFPFVSRESDWAECMWQIWLEHLGDIDIKQTTDWVKGSPVALEPTSMVNKVRRRLSAKYRSETCMLATRQLAALKTPERRGADAKKSRWLKRNCREWMTLA